MFGDLLLFLSGEGELIAYPDRIIATFPSYNVSRLATVRCDLCTVGVLEKVDAARQHGFFKHFWMGNGEQTGIDKGTTGGGPQTNKPIISIIVALVGEEDDDNLSESLLQ